MKWNKNKMKWNKMRKWFEDVQMNWKLIHFLLCTDKTMADVVEALIGTFLVHSSARSAQLFMSWLGLCVLPQIPESDGKITAERWGYFLPSSIPNPMLRNDPDADLVLHRLTAGFDDFETRIGYKYELFPTVCPCQVGLFFVQSFLTFSLFC